jgi:hypothetical protein
VNDTGEPDVVATEAHQHAVEDLPDEAMLFLLASRYCETDRLSEIAWSLFGKTPRGWGRVQAICDYEHARASRTAWEAYCDRTGVYRDYAHLTVALCRCMIVACDDFRRQVRIRLLRDAPHDREVGHSPRGAKRFWARVVELYGRVRSKALLGRARDPGGELHGSSRSSS